MKLVGKVRPSRKVFVTIEKGKYAEGVKGGREFTSVGFMASIYGSSSPCDTKEEIERAIAHCKNWIIKEGDIPVVDNKIEAKTLTAWF